MKLRDVLARLGILRTGATAATYRSGAERPAELMMDGVLDARRDLANGANVTDIRKAGEAKKHGDSRH